MIVILLRVNLARTHVTRNEWWRKVGCANSTFTLANTAASGIVSNVRKYDSSPDLIFHAITG